MSTEMTEHRSEPSSIDASATTSAGATIDRDSKSSQMDPTRKPTAQPLWQRRLLIGAGVLVLVVAAVFGIPWIRFSAGGWMRGG